MKRIYRVLTLIILSSLLFFACTREEVFPPEPAITFLDFSKIANNLPYDDKGELKIFFTDGDGDLGLNDDDTMPPFNKASIYYYNFFIKYLEKQHGKFVEVNPPVSFNARIPRIESKGNSPSIKGEIDLEIFINNYLSTFDTVKFEASICDRALHVSNVITTPEIIIKKH